MSEPQRDIVYVLHWGDLASTIRMLAIAPTLREVHKRGRIVLLTRPDFESFLKHSPYFNAIEIDALPDIDVTDGLGYVFDAVRTIRRELDGKVPLIGFAGSP